MKTPDENGFYWYIEDDGKLEIMEVVVIDGIVNYYLPGEDFTYKAKDLKGRFVNRIVPAYNYF